MQFNSVEFIFLFLPVTVILYYCLGKKDSKLSLGWLFIASLIFYAWWNPSYLVLLSFSIIVNYLIGTAIQKVKLKNILSPSVEASKFILMSGIIFNLSLLGYFKYANFFIDNLNKLTGSSYHLNTIVLPLAISFFTFQQITYLVDSYKDNFTGTRFLQYCAYVTFFPHLIAGPICRHKEILPQFDNKEIFIYNHDKIAAGLTIFAIGLFKKVVLADGVSVYATPVFDAAEQFIPISFFEAWRGALSYTFQIYFDFSGYSDMAIGLAKMFGLLLPLNFNSPYKALNIIEFWRNWHITLSRFLRDYLYIPLGGNRKGTPRSFINLMVTMVLGGIWHGAGWTFMAWGALHGIYLVVNHAWRDFRQGASGSGRTSRVARRLSQLITFMAVVIAWVLFRAKSFGGAVNILKGMAGMQGFVLPKKYLTILNFFNGAGNYLVDAGWQFRKTALFNGDKDIRFLLLLFILVSYAPNTQQFMVSYKPTLETYYSEIRSYRWSFMLWRPNFIWFNLITILTIYSVYQIMVSGYEEFIYQFF